MAFAKDKLVATFAGPIGFEPCEDEILGKEKAEDFLRLCHLERNTAYPIHYISPGTHSANAFLMIIPPCIKRLSSKQIFHAGRSPKPNRGWI